MVKNSRLEVWPMKIGTQQFESWMVELSVGRAQIIIKHDLAYTCVHCTAVDKYSDIQNEIPYDIQRKIV